MNSCTLAADGLVIVRTVEALAPSRDRIVIPRSVLPGLLTALHLRLSHPSKYQTKQVFDRYFYALDPDIAISLTNAQCHQCTSLKSLPRELVPQSTSDPPGRILQTFCADIMVHNRHKILVVRECVTLFTCATIIHDETSESIRNALLCILIEFRPMDGPMATVRTDNAPGFRSISTDPLLAQNRIAIELGRVKNPNKNPIAEAAIRELRVEIANTLGHNDSISPVTLASACARLNSRLRDGGLSSRERLWQRDQFTCEPIPVDDSFLLSRQHSKQLANHPSSTVSKAPRASVPHTPDINIGQLIYIKSDLSKTSPRPRYLVVAVDDQWIHIRKFTDSQLRNFTYKVLASECIIIKSEVPILTPIHSDSDEDEFVTPPSSPTHTPVHNALDPVDPVAIALPIEPDVPVAIPPDLLPHNDIDIAVPGGDDNAVLDNVPAAPEPAIVPVQPGLRRSHRVRKPYKAFDAYKNKK